ncbi:MoaD/ThiS family protein [Candidatus Woesearchaeota archaeon]|nr:MoaD/ThiS family protein [Candidatus Woesearchaeota archaeon]
MKIFIEKTNKNMNKKFIGTVGKLLSELKINPETVLVTRSNELITDDIRLKDKDNIKILSVVSGG